MELKAFNLIGQMKRIYPCIIVLLLLFISETLFAQSQKKQNEYDIDIYDVVIQPDLLDRTKVIDTVTVRFNLFTKGKKEDSDRFFDLAENEPIKVTVKEYIGNKEGRGKPVYIEGSLKKLREKSTLTTKIPEGLTISLLIDRSGSINQEYMYSIKSAIEEFVKIVPPESKLFCSFFDEDVSESQQVTRSNLDFADFTVTDRNIALYNALYTKLMEFDSTAVIPNEDFEPGYVRNPDLQSGTDGKKIIILITNGENKIDEIEKFTEDRFTIIREPDLINKIESYQNKIFIYALSVGQESSDPEFLKMICTASGNQNDYYTSEPDSVLDFFNKLGVKIALQKSDYDYEIKLRYQYYTTFRGENRKLELAINTDRLSFSTPKGGKQFSKGDPLLPRTTGEKQLLAILLWGLLAGIIVLLLVMIVIQLLIPLIRNKIFVIKYVKKYKPSGNIIYKECPYCGDPLNPGDKVVLKCEHIVHHLCWKDYDHMCPEYGQNCNDGIEKFFDISDPFSKKNKIYYLSWVLYGMIGGFLTWIYYILVIRWPGFFENFSEWMTKFIRPAIIDSNLIAFKDKITPFLIIGTFMGFFLTVFLSYLEEYRHKDLSIYGKILLRGLLGGLSGFVAFLIGSIILIIINRPNLWIFDLIPWIFFGTSIGYIMSIRTTIVWKHGVIGGLISMIFCFFMIYALISDLEENAILVGFMLYGAGLGFSIANIRSRSEHFFLKVLQGKKNQDIIPVHKWMSDTGGHNEVYIGRAFACEIQMNWEKNNEEIAQKHAKMYINNRGLPVLISLLKEKTIYFNDRFDLDAGKEYQLYNGVKFKIGQTVFQYIEVD
jgi:ABC-type multidrug transport system fused ATPase/permease subunit